MSSSSPPNPTTTTADFLKSVARQNPRKHQHPHPSIYQNLYNPQPAPPFPQPPNSTPILGRGFVGYTYAAVNRPYSDVLGQSFNQSAASVSASANPKAVGQSSVAVDNSLKNTRDKNGDDTSVIIRDRKVQVTEGTSLYAQCRSWLKNGYITEKPVCLEKPKSLPKPLPASAVEPRNEDDMEVEEKIEDVEHLSAKELLQQHVNRAKKVRSRLRNQRLQRIERYKDRLALLLPPAFDQQPKTDPT